MPYRKALARVTTSIDMPFGYTLTLWGSAELTFRFLGKPGVGEVVALVAGALGGYFLIGILFFSEMQDVRPLRTRRAVVFNAVPIGAIGLVALLDHVGPGGRPGYFIAGLMATAAYIALLALGWAWDMRRLGGASSGSPSSGSR